MSGYVSHDPSAPGFPLSPYGPFAQVLSLHAPVTPTLFSCQVIQGGSGMALITFVHNSHESWLFGVFLIDYKSNREVEKWRQLMRKWLWEVVCILTWGAHRQCTKCPDRGPSDPAVKFSVVVRAQDELSHLAGGKCLLAEIELAFLCLYDPLLESGSL